MKSQLQVVNFEITNGCNYNCRICGDEKKRPVHFMDPEIFHEVLERYKTEHPENLPEIRLFLSGEPTTHPDFLKFISICNILGYNCLVHTNGSLWRSEFSEHLKSLPNDKAITTISFSLDGYDENTYELTRGIRNRPNVALKIKDHCERVYESKNIQTVVQSIVPSDYHLHDAIYNYNDIMFLKARTYVRRTHNWDNGPVANGNYQYPKQCSFPFNTLVLYSNWQVGKCCADLNAKCTFGDFFDAPYYGSIYEAFHGTRMNEIRNKMLRQEHIEHCCTCERYMI